MQNVLKGSVAKFFIPMGVNAGTPCWYINYLPSKEQEGLLSDSEIIEKVVGSKLKTVAVRGNLSDDPNIIETLRGLASKGYEVIFITSASEDIGPVRRVPNLKFSIKAKVPNSKENTVRNEVVGLLSANDELEFSVDNMEQYVQLIEWLKPKVRLVPTIVFNVTRATDRTEIFQRYLDETEKFSFKSRIMAPLNLLNDSK